MKKLNCFFIVFLLLAAMLTGCGGDQGQKQTQTTEAAEGNTEYVLTISGSEGEKTYTVPELEQLGLETHSYSGRNKENNNERQVREYTGISLTKLLKDAGYSAESETIKVICSDGYSREYELSSLLDLYFFDGEKAKKGEKVEPMLAVITEGESMGNDKTYKSSEGSPLRLVFGQADYDSSYTMDFNMQGWASYVEKIEVTTANE